MGAHCTHYHGPLVDGLVVGDTRALPLAPRLLRPAHRATPYARRPSAPSRAGRSSSKTATSSCARSAKRQHRRHAPSKPSGKAPDKNCDRWRRCGRLCRSREAPTRAIPRQHRHVEQRRRRADRPAEFVQGLSRRQCARGLDPAAPGQLLFRERHRPASQRERYRHRPGVARGRARRREQGLLRPAAARDRRRTGAPVDPGSRPTARVHAALARRLPGHHRASQDGAPGGCAGRELYRA